MLRFGATWILVCLSTISFKSLVLADDLEQGRLAYLRTCASCHGDDGRGRGPVSVRFRQKPADLTTLAQRNGGIYSAAAIYEAIDGRKAAGAHTNSRMPIWGCRHGTSARRTSKADKINELDSLLDLPCDSESVTRRRIESIVNYLATIQVK